MKTQDGAIALNSSKPACARIRARATKQEAGNALRATLKASGPEDCLGLGIQRLALRCLAADAAEALDAELLPRCHDRLDPGLCLAALVSLLPRRRRRLGDNLAALVLHELSSRQAAGSLLLGSPH